MCLIPFASHINPSNRFWGTPILISSITSSSKLSILGFLWDRVEVGRPFLLKQLLCCALRRISHVNRALPRYPTLDYHVPLSPSTCICRDDIEDIDRS